jgi:hypothetical protein
MGVAAVTFKDAPFIDRPTISLDTETEAFVPGMMIPRLVSVATCASVQGPAILHHHSDLRLRAIIFSMVEGAAARKLTIVGQNIAYDLAVLCRKWPDLLPLVFDALDVGSIVDTQTAAKFIANFHGRLFDDAKRTSYSLSTQCRQIFGVELDKDEDGWRLRFGELLNVPLAQWPERATAYATDDALWTLRVWSHWVKAARQLEKVYQLPHAVFGNLPARARVAFAAKLSTAWGIHTDPVQTAHVELDAVTQAAHAHKVLKQHGLFKVYTTGERAGDVQINPKTGMPKMDSKAVIALIRAHMPSDYPHTAGGTKTRKDGSVAPPLPSTDAAHMERHLKGKHVALDAYLERAEVQKTITTWLPLLRAGIVTPIHSSVDELKNTGRLAYFKPNLQQLPRKEGVREAFVPRPGKLLCSVDYDGAELRAWGQACLWLLGKSTMATFFQRDPKGDAHAKLAASMLGTSYEDVLARKKVDTIVKEARQNAKPANFGFLANMGEKRFIATQANADPPVYFTEDEAIALKKAFKTTWGAQDYFDYIQKRMGWDETVRGRSFGSNRYRGGMTYTALANSYFQQLVADGACEALYELVKRQYDPRHVDWAGRGSKMLIFVHDESFCEVDEERAHEQAFAIRDVQVSALQRWCPDVPITAMPALMRRWSKGADEAYDKNGRLIAWEPKPKTVGPKA